MKLPGVLLWLLAGSAFAQESAEFRITSSYPKYVTADLEFRDPSGALWPSFLYGKPASESGFIRFDSAAPAAQFALRCDQQVQAKGDQSRRVLGALPAPLSATLAIDGMTAPVPASRAKGNKATHTAELNGTLEIGGRKLRVKAITGLWVHDGRGDEKHRGLMLDGRFTVPGAALGRTSLATVEVRFGLTAFPPEAGAKK